MNLAMIRYVLGWTLGIEGAFMALPCLVALVYGETAGWWFVPVALGMEEVRLYFIIVLASISVIVFQLCADGAAFGKTLRDAAFQAASIITTTGFTTVDFNQWPQTSRSVLVILMFIGACAGSTGGGIKVSRISILCKTMFKELHSYVMPKSVRKVELDGKPLNHEVVRGVNVFLVSYLLVFTLVGAADQPGRRGYGDQLHRRGRHLQQHRPRPGTGGAHRKLRAFQPLYQGGAVF